MQRSRKLLSLLVSVTFMSGCRGSLHPAGNRTSPQDAKAGGAADLLAPITPPRTPADWIVNRAKEEVRRGVTYDASYRRLSYPGGDVPLDRGACSDVVVRSLRAAGYDLQKLIHEDMERSYDLYPHKWVIRHPDPNIDHRRGANHIAFFRRHARVLSTNVTGAAVMNWQPGDLVYWKMGQNLDHCGIISNVRDPAGIPLVIHNIGQARQEDCLTAWKIAAHFRYPK